MNRLQKFVEMGKAEQDIGRIAFAFDLSTLPEPSVGLTWRPINRFNPTDEIVADPRLKSIFEEALRQGYALTRPSRE
jgi:hypothetical protein